MSRKRTASGSGYEFVESLYVGARVTAHRVLERSTLRTVVLRVPNHLGRAADAAALDEEREILELLPLDCRIVNASTAGLEAPRALATVDVGGQLLSTLIPVAGMPIEQALTVALGLVELIRRLHAGRVIHKGIAAPAILFNPESGEVDLLCHGLASRIPRETRQLVHPDRLEGEPGYISPEQTGRMNRAVDYRSDYYSLGVTIYHMLCGRLPFEGADPFEVVHAHIARQAVPPKERRSEVPDALSAIVMKLMAKNAEDRYQSSVGLYEDLRTCQRAVASGEAIAPFDLGRDDVFERFRVPQKLYGREGEVDALLSAFDRAGEGHVEFVLVSGISGVGKTALVQEIHRPITARRGFYVTGKHDPHKLNIPYHAIAAALRDLVRQLLTERRDSVAKWKEELNDALRGSGQLMIDIAPELELVMGPQAPVTTLPPDDAQLRFNAVFTRFVHVLAGGARPFVLFLDDMQWIDTASLALIRHLAAEASQLRLLLVGAYRDNEVDAMHPVAVVADELRKGDAALSEIALAPLDPGSVQEIVADTLRCDGEVSARLARVLVAKTGGNPFFLLRFLKTLSDEDYLRFEPGARQWVWDETEIDSMESTKNVVDLVVSQFQKLPQETQGALRLAACIGSAFDLETLVELMQQPPQRVAETIWEAVQHGEVVPQITASVADEGEGAARVSLAAMSLSPEGVRFRFIHDRVQQAAAALNSEDELKSIHLRIGRLLWSKYGEDGLDEHVFDIVSHLTQSVDLLASPEERRDVAGLCLRAGRRAKGSSAYQAARAYLERGLELVGADAWSKDYEFAVALYFDLAECAYAGGDSERAEELFAEILAKAWTDLERARVQQLRANIAVHAVQYELALECTLKGLEILGTKIPDADDPEGLQALASAEGEALAPMLEGKEIADLVDLPVMSHPSRLIEADLLNELALVGLFFYPLMIQVATVRLVRLSLAYGNARASGPAYATYGMTIGSALGQYEAGHAFGKMALALTQRQQDPLAESIVCFWFGALNSFWRAPVDESIEVCKRGVDVGQRIGAPLWTAYSGFFVGVHMLFRGAPIPENLKAFERYMPLQDPHASAGNAAYVQLLRAMRGESDSPTGFDEPGWDNDHISEMRAANHLLALQHYFTARLMSHVLLGRTADALDTAERAAEEGDIHTVLFGQLASAGFLFHHALALADRWREGCASDVEAAKLRATLDGYRERLKTWAENAPGNFLAPWGLVEAAVAVAAGDQVAAMDYFDAAIDAAEAYDMAYHEALANERAARFYLARGRRRIAIPYLRAARIAYARWDATAKIEELETAQPDVFRYVTRTGCTEPASMQVSGGFDMESVLKGARIVSAQIEIDKLLESSVALVIENAGAQRGVLLLDHGGELRAEAVVDVDHVETTSRDVPASIIEYCRRTHEPIVLADAVADELFGADPHIVAARPRSVLAMPLLSKGKSIGILYLENRRSTDAFTFEHVHVLEALCAQIAVSIENARVYENLEHRVEQRTAQLAEAKEAAEDANQAKSAFLASMSHELRTPINAILAYGDLIKEGLAEEGLNAFTPDLDKINWAGTHLLSLINDILDLSKIEAGKLELYPEEVALPTLVSQVEGAVRPLVTKNNNQFLVDCPEDVGSICSDPTRVRQILFNVLSNASKFTEEGRVSLSVRRVKDDGLARVVCRVTDTGIGMTPAQLQHVFEPFRQADATTTRRFGGTGLGLTISQRFCDMLGGQIRAESEPGVGTTVEIQLPVEAPFAALAETPGPERRPAGVAPGTRRKGPVLVIDDDEAVRDYLSRKLTKEGLVVVCAADGEEGLRLSRELRPRAITLDVVMPGMDGWEVLLALKSDPDTVDIPVTMLSMTDDKKRGYALGAAEYLTKPVDPDLLQEVIRRHVEGGAGSVLIVDPDPKAREVLRADLETQGFAVREAVDGEAGLGILGETAFDLVLVSSGGRVQVAFSQDASSSEEVIAEIERLIARSADEETSESQLGAGDGVATSEGH